MITVGLRLRLGLRLGNIVRVRVSIRVSVRVGVADCCIQTAGESDKTRISHVIKTDQWRSDLQIRSAFSRVPVLTVEDRVMHHHCVS